MLGSGRIVSFFVSIVYKSVIVFFFKFFYFVHRIKINTWHKLNCVITVKVHFRWQLLCIYKFLIPVTVTSNLLFEYNLFSCDLSVNHEVWCALFAYFLDAAVFVTSANMVFYHVLILRALPPTTLINLIVTHDTTGLKKKTPTENYKNKKTLNIPL